MRSNAGSAKKLEAIHSERPEIFSYHDYRVFLKDWLAYLKATKKDFSLRALAAKAGLSLGYLPMVVSGARKLSGKALAKLGPVMGLSPRERSFLEILVSLGNAETQEVRLDAVARMRRFAVYRKRNGRETEVFQYLTHWYYVAIREMTALPDFSLDPAWIQARLKFHVDLKEIETAIDFLSENKFIEIQADGKVRPPEKTLDCLGGVYRLALTQYHRELFTLAGKSIEVTPSDERSIAGHTFALDADKFDEARKIVEEALEKVRALSGDSVEGDSVYHLELALFPLTKPKKNGN